MSMTVGTLFSGVGGFDLAASWLWGPECIRFQCEIDEFCRRVLARHWPQVVRYGDIKEVDWASVGPVDLVCAGPPCQPVSVAGKRRGEADDRWLWGEMVAAVRTLRPRWLVCENPPGFKELGLEAVSSALERLGYEVRTVDLPAASLGACHIRQRVFIICHRAAHPDGARCQSGRQSGDAGRSPTSVRSTVEPGAGAADGHHSGQFARDAGIPSGPCGGGALGGVLRVDDGISSGMDGPGASWQPDWSRWPDCPPTVKPRTVWNRGARIKALGNAVVPPVAYQVLRAIAESER